VLFVRRDGGISWRNAAGEKILVARDGLLESNDVLVAAERQCAARLRTAIAAMTSHTKNGRSEPGTVVSVPRTSGLRPLSVLVAPVQACMRAGMNAVAVLFVTDPDTKPRAALEVIRGLFGLTPAEARLACAVLHGDTLEEYCDRESISLNTGRTHLKRIFSKTGTSRQSDLVRLLLGSVAVLHGRNRDTRST